MLSPSAAPQTHLAAGSMAERSLPVARWKSRDGRCLTRAQGFGTSRLPHREALTLFFLPCGQAALNRGGRFEEVRAPWAHFQAVTKNRLTASQPSSPQTRSPQRSKKVARRHRRAPRPTFFDLLINFRGETVKRRAGDGPTQHSRKGTGSALVPLLMCGEKNKYMCHFEEGCQHKAAVSGASRLARLCTRALCKHTPTCAAPSQERRNGFERLSARGTAPEDETGQGRANAEEGHGVHDTAPVCHTHTHTQPDWTVCVCVTCT